MLGELDDVSHVPAVLAAHCAVVEAQLQAYGGGDTPGILAKYEWLADYHNFVCELHGVDSTIAGQPGRSFSRYAPPPSKVDALEAATALHDELQE